MAESPKVTYQFQREAWAQMYPEVRLYARNQILADLMVYLADSCLWWDRVGGATVEDYAFRLTPEQMTALEDAILEHKAKEE